MDLTRREMLQAVGGTAVLSAAACGNSKDASSEAYGGTGGTTATAVRLPTVYLPHGGGPWPFVETGFGAPGVLESYLKRLSNLPPVRPSALLIVSAHWEAARPTVMAAENPPMLYDYYGFPEEAYHVQWPAPGAPDLAETVRERLESAKIPAALDASRGFDHGTFAVTALAYPEAEIPTLQLSLNRNLDPAEHLRIGRALAPFRDEGVFIIGSGMSYHNLPRFMEVFRGNSDAAARESRAFDDWLYEAVSAEPDTRDTRLAEWERAPSARACHPREEHLLPLMVIAGAGGDDPGKVPYRDVIYGAHTSAVQFG